MVKICLMEKNDVANFFWVGQVTFQEFACFNSFLKNGFTVNIWTYDNELQDSNNYLKEEEFNIKNAEEILPSTLLRSFYQGRERGSISSFSNLFRYQLLIREGGWWFDADCFCIKNIKQSKNVPVLAFTHPKDKYEGLLSDWLDGNGNPVPLPEGVVVVAAAPPSRFISEEAGVPKVMNYTPEANASPWYCFLLEQNLAEYEPMELAEGQYRLDNLDGEFSSWVILENGNRSRIVREVVNDRIDNRFTPAGFNIGSIGSIGSGRS